MTPAPKLTNNPFHALANHNDEDAPSVTTWLPPPSPTSVPRTPAPWAHVAPFQQATPTRLVFDNAASPSGPNTTPQPSPPPLPRVSVTPSPIAYCTRVTSCTTAPQFLGCIGTTPYPYSQNNMVSTHLDLPICRPMLSTGAFGTWVNRICLPLHKAGLSGQGTQPCIPG